MGELPLASHAGDRIFARLVNRCRVRIRFDRLLMLGWGCNSHQSTSEIDFSTRQYRSTGGL
jgi:hypothetical protein